MSFYSTYREEIQELRAGHTTKKGDLVDKDGNANFAYNLKALRPLLLEKLASWRRDDHVYRTTKIDTWRQIDADQPCLKRSTI